MLAIEIIEDFESLLEDKNCPLFLSRETVQKILKSYKAELGNDKFGSEANKARIEHFYQGASDLNKHYKDFDLEIFRAANASGQSAMRAAFLINGGASIALAAFIGTLSASDSAVISPTALASPLAIFATGSFVAAISFGATYITQMSQGFTDEKEKWRNNLASFFNMLAIACGLGAYAFFGLGLYFATQIMTG